MPLGTNLVEFPHLSHQAFQHPADLRATAALRKVRGLDKVIKFASQKAIEQLFHFENISSRLRVNANQYPSIHKQFVRMAQILDVKKLPSLYIETTPTINAFAAGVENYSIVLCSGLMDIMDEDELLAILGHELGHVKCEHQLYKTTASVLTLFGDLVISQAGSLGIPGVEFLLSAASGGVKFAIMDWNRKAELSCDRAALLVTQNEEKVASALAKLGGYSSKYADELNLDEAERQAELYQELGTDSVFMKLLKLQAMMKATHPYPVVRVKEIRQWARSSEYQDILNGNYKSFKALLAAGFWQDVIVGTLRGKECPNAKCKYPNDDDFTFCLNCQTNIRSAQLICSKCCKGVDDDWNVCMTCGFRLKPQELPEANTAV
jgi:Zn-dependent protease with chaperone function